MGTMHRILQGQRQYFRLAGPSLGPDRRRAGIVVVSSTSLVPSGVFDIIPTPHVHGYTFAIPGVANYDFPEGAYLIDCAATSSMNGFKS